MSEFEAEVKGAHVCVYMKRDILDRDQHRCVNCGISGTAYNKLHIHHIRHRLPCRREDLVTLCSKCHRELHSNHPDLKTAPKFSQQIRNLTKLRKQAEAET